MENEEPLTVCKASLQERCRSAGAFDFDAAGVRDVTQRRQDRAQFSAAGVTPKFSSGRRIRMAVRATPLVRWLRSRTKFAGNAGSLQAKEGDMGMEAGFNRPPSRQLLPDVGLTGGETP